MITMKSQFNFQTGTVITGKWHRKTYQILRELGSGANGVVFLATTNNKKVALKFSEDYNIITSEVNILKSFAKAQGDALGPSLLDVDDWVDQNRKIPFYAMEYIEGTHFLTFIKQKGYAWLDVLILQLLADLDTLHKKGWVFGDLKPDNLIVSHTPSYKIRCIDVGGTTLIGRAIKEYTEFFDRGYWGLGSRKAEPTYDLFSVAMVMINAYYPQRFSKKEGGIKQLMQVISDHPELRKYQPVLINALTGKYQSAGEMRTELLNLAQQAGQGKSRIAKRKIGIVSNTATRKGQQTKQSNFTETILILALVSFLYAFYILERLL